jgi:peptidoglycan/xylan/chitin deacetylase (PgdA/CDA1 family)
MLVYQADPFSGGETLPPKTLCLTYDDGPGVTTGPGPGPRTVELAEYLQAEGIAATFFMVGRHARQLPKAVRTVRDRGHLVGNHTDTHRSLLEVIETGGEAGVVEEIARTDQALASVIDGPVYVRAPYGHWSEEVAVALNRAPHVSDGHIGPVHWDVNASDWHHWGEGRSPERCSAAYVDEIERVGRGVVLMHDCAADPTDEGVRLKAGNRTLELTKLLVPELKERGYSFVRLDEIPGIAARAG